MSIGGLIVEFEFDDIRPKWPCHFRGLLMREHMFDAEGAFDLSILYRLGEACNGDEVEADIGHYRDPLDEKE
jgi:hypothetical protein